MLYLAGNVPPNVPRKAVILFPGDVSDLHAEMTDLHEYSLEVLASRVRARIPETSDLIVIRPAVSPRGCFAHYTYFLGGMGHYMHMREEPTHCKDDTTACKHLMSLVTNFEETEGVKFEGYSIVGFSKGCQVLKALVGSPEWGMWKGVVSVYFVDAGLHHPGVFPPPADVAAVMSGAETGSPCTVHLIATARQVNDENREFIRQEFEATPCTTREVLPGMTLDDHFQCLFNMEWRG